MKPFFIAEIGVNHFGSFDKAKQMVIKAKACGAHAVKFQKYNPVKVLGKDSPYLNDAHQLSWKELTELSVFARKMDLKFGCSVFEVNDIPIVDAISDYHKIASRMNLRAEFIAEIMRRKKPTYMSVQPATASRRIPERFNLMWCIREYPSLKEDVLKYPYSNNFGLSSHCPDWTASFEAFKQGARIMEHHVCDSREEIGCDIASSLTFDEYRKLIRECTNHIAAREASLSR